jgi:beta-lactamase class A
VFALVFTLMAGFVVAVTMSAIHKGKGPAGGSSGTSGIPASGRLQPVVGGASVSPARGGRGKQRSTRTLDERLAAALRSLERSQSGRFAVAVADVATGKRALFGAGRHFHAASIEKADILAGLLLTRQRTGTAVSASEAAAAVPMIERSSDDAATELYAAVGGRTGMAVANTQLGLTQTVMGPGQALGLTSTTAGDQLRLLADLTASTSPLSVSSRDYELGLMENVLPGQRWGVSAVATTGTSYAVKDGWLGDPRQWVTNSIGIVQDRGQRLLIAVLADRQPTKAAGMALDAAVAATAARVILDA